MENPYRLDSRMAQITDKALCLIKLNILWMVCSLPLVTGGAALCALHITAVKILNNEESYIFQDFWAVFKLKLTPSLKFWLPLLLAAFALLFDYRFWQGIDGDFSGMIRVFTCVLFGIWTVLVFYVFPLAARMDVPAKTTYRNGILLMFKYLPQSIYLLFLTAIFLTAGLLWTPVFYIMVLSGGSLLAAIHGKMLLWIFEKEGILTPKES